MTRSRIVLIALVCLVAGAALRFWPDRASDTAARQARAPGVPQPPQAPHSPVPAPASASPFGKGAPPSIDLAAQRAARRARMEAGGYGTPPEYYLMDLATLTAKAAKGDINAMLQLAEQYESESAALINDPAFEARANPRQLGRRYFEEAALAGHKRVVAVIAEKYLADGKPLEAYTWELLAEKLGERGASGPRLQASAALDAQQRALAEAKLSDLTQRVGAGAGSN